MSTSSSSESTRAFKERISPVAGAFLRDQTLEIRKKIAELIRELQVDPDIDNFRKLSVDITDGKGRVLVEPDFTIYYDLVGEEVQVYAIQPTKPRVGAAVSALQKSLIKESLR